MTDAPERIWAFGKRYTRNKSLGLGFGGAAYILDTPEALAKSPHVEALVKAAEARGMERAADYLDVAEHDAQERNWQSGANAFDALSCAIRAEAALTKIARLGQKWDADTPETEYERKVAQMKEDFPNGI